MSTLDLPEPSERTATDALHAIGLDGAALQRIARRVANDYCRRTNTRLDSRMDDFISHLQLVGLQAAMRYDPTRANGEQGQSFMWKIMEHRCEDFLRRKSEGFGDRRYGNDGRIVLTDEFDLNPDEFDDFLTDHRRTRFSEAAEKRGMTLKEWMLFRLHDCADEDLAA